MADQVAPSVDIYDISGDKPVLGSISPEEVEPAIASGKYSFPKEAHVPVISPDGVQGSIDPAEASQAFSQGYKFATPALVDQSTYGSTGQQIGTAAEGLAQGVAGPLATAAEVGLKISTPEAIRKRAEINPSIHSLLEAAGFGGSLLTGIGEGALVAHAGEAAIARAGFESANIASKIANGAIRAGAEMALVGSSDELTKAITQDPNQTVGSAVSEIGLSALLGAATGGAFAGVGGLAGATLEKIGASEVINDFKNRIGVRASGVSQADSIGNELKGTLDFYHSVGNEISGVEGLKSEALKTILPKEVSPEMANSVFDTSNKAIETIQQMEKEGVPERLIKKYQNKLNDFMAVATDANATPAEHFDALNTFKKDLADFSKGNYGDRAVAAHSDAYDFLNITKNLSREVRLGLEDPEVWGKSVSDLQKNINAAWSASIKPAQQIEQKLMSMVGNERLPNPTAIGGYLKEGEKVTSQSIRQQIMGKFVDSMEQFHKAAGDIYEKTGLEKPVMPGMGALKESLNKPSLGNKLADAWYDKLGAQAAGNTLGAIAGAHIIPGSYGALLGRETLGPALTAIIQPLAENVANSKAFKQSMLLGEAAVKGAVQLQKASKGMFSGAEILPVIAIPKEKDIRKLDKQLGDLHANQNQMFNISGDLGHYMPDHATALASTAMNAVNLSNLERPKTVKESPLDPEAPLTKAQKSDWDRTLTIAEQPLMVMKNIKEGTLLPSDIVTVKSLYPAFYNKMAQEITSAMATHISKGQTIPYHMRQSLSMFLGEPLDSSLRPQNIMAAQGTFTAQQQQQAPPKKNTDKLNKVSSQYHTAQQAADSRSKAAIS